jgi:dTMP kinase
MTRGLFISFEGIDGAGKSTHIARVAELFRQAGRMVVLTREPGGTPVSEKLRELVLHEPMDPLTEALLMFAARREHLVQVIEPALARGDVVLCDRFTDATFAYQGGGRGFDWQILGELEGMVQALPDGSLRQPDLTVWFDLDPQIAADRLASARVPDKFESQPINFFAAVRAAYARRQAEMPSRFARIDAAQTLEAVGTDVSRIVSDWLQGTAA